METDPPRHAYVHVPFCRRKCDYCGFYSLPVSSLGCAAAPAGAGGDPASAARGRPASDITDAYVGAVRSEWHAIRGQLGIGRLRTVFLGGGTPSLLGPERLQRLLGAFDGFLTPHAEVTVETNPEDADAEYAAWAAARGIRVSLGVQSFSDSTRRSLGRSTEADPVAAFERLRAAGCRKIGLDLIFGVPGQTVADVEAEVERIAELGPEHVSWYELEPVEGTPLGERISRTDASGLPGDDAAGRPSDDAGGRPGDDAGGRPGAEESGERRRLDSAERGGDERAGSDECAGGDGHAVDKRAGGDDRAEMYRRIVAGLQRLGYDWYEVSNFARPGHRCRHNSAIWHGEDYVGLGPAAVGTVARVRRHNLPDLSGYLAAPHDPPHSIEHLDDCTRMRERLYLASRIGLAVPLSEVSPVLDHRVLQALDRLGLVSVRSGTLRVTRKGRYVADEVCVRLFRDFCVKGQD